MIMVVVIFSTVTKSDPLAMLQRALGPTLRTTALENLKSHLKQFTDRIFTIGEKLKFAPFDQRVKRPDTKLIQSCTATQAPLQRHKLQWEWVERESDYTVYERCGNCYCKTKQVKLKQTSGQAFLKMIRLDLSENEPNSIIFFLCWHLCTLNIQTTTHLFL